MAIDLQALKRASEGDKTKKVAVNKQWLEEVHSELEALEVLRRHVLKQEQTKRKVSEQDWNDGWSKFDSSMDGMFGQGGAFDKLFGSKKKL